MDLSSQRRWVWQSMGLPARLSPSVIGPTVLIAIASALLTLLPPPAAHAAACCVSATSFGVGRLLIWEDFALGLQLGHARLLGLWDPAGNLHANPPGYAEGISHAQAWLIVRLHQRIELQGWLPYLVNDRWSTTSSQIAGGFGDAGMAVRTQVLAIGEIDHLPSFAITVGGFAPTGRRVEQTSAPLFAGTTGRGAWGGSIAVESEYAPLPWFIRLEAGWTAFLPFERSDNHKREQYGHLLRVCLSSGREVVPARLVAAIAALAEWQSRLQIDGVTVDDSAARLFSVAVSLSWRFAPHWTGIVSATNSVWPDGMGTNQDARIDATLGVRYGHF